MLQYLIILLGDSSVSYCHYEIPKMKRNLISLENLRTGIMFAMKQNLMIQFVYPNCELPTEYHAVIETVNNYKIIPSSLNISDADVIVFEGFDSLSDKAVFRFGKKNFVIRASKADFFAKSIKIVPLLRETERVNIVLTDIETLTDLDFMLYKKVLSELKDALKNLCTQGGTFPQLNMLTDRIFLDKMNNCNAGIENITLAPDGKFYVCPAFYLEDERDSVGDLVSGIEIKNRQLFKLEYAPICRRCDAFQCKRCVWLNRLTTREINTPSHEQCVVAHLERNASRQLLLDLQQDDVFADKKIKEVNYLDPFDE